MQNPQFAKSCLPKWRDMERQALSVRSVTTTPNLKGWKEVLHKLAITPI
jgi:uncharacterized LabA/DUF88 family protein